MRELLSPYPDAQLAQEKQAVPIIDLSQYKKFWETEIKPRQISQ